ncbi:MULTISPECIES: DUF4426 domain-containing protein [Pseudidiomarina]|uniref:Uncharacterized protein DUF4426 n=2 Tax=Pseudidiomarina TaxID=2800384 RepID=A0A368UQ52_9GAMM|nr:MULTISPECIES: DUF4426 domain-containing protein [Pseudidiomarina]PWW10607.1 uncharacterized protein DUF4426 [Pseudidiomarina maritima]RBP88355.1 uncharacterized protein DUF4426 [Pseudidiomarina tainanensis]RCW30285.1 uncharacterized protein DUF4426 [Pseudidiomarina tainanensis]
MNCHRSSRGLCSCTWVRLLSIAVLGLLALLSATAQAEQSKRLGPWEVHYNAFNSTLLRPEMAKEYNLQRSKYLGTVNIAVLAADIAGKPAQQVAISGYVMNPLSMQQTLEFQEVIEGDAVYYLTQVEFTHLETLRFYITIKQGNQQQELRFSKEFWAN